MDKMFLPSSWPPSALLRLQYLPNDYYSVDPTEMWQSISLLFHIIVKCCFVALADKQAACSWCLPETIRRAYTHLPVVYCVWGVCLPLEIVVGKKGYDREPKFFLILNFLVSRPHESKFLPRLLFALLLLSANFRIKPQEGLIVTLFGRAEKEIKYWKLFRQNCMYCVRGVSHLK